MSRLSRQAHGVADMRGLLQAFARESAGMLLFLKNVERMSVFEWSPGQGEPKQVTPLSQAPAWLLLEYGTAGIVCRDFYSRVEIPQPAVLCRPVVASLPKYLR